MTPPSAGVAKVTEWVTESRNNGGRPFIVLDKAAAELFVFDATGKPVARGPALIGIAPGDDSAPGVGEMELSRIPVALRTTPTGRFEARFGPALGHKEDVLWVDFATAISLHPVVTGSARERRMERLQSPSPQDNRITYGCINVARPLYDGIIAPLFRQGGVVYVLPETRPLATVFAGLPPEAPRGQASFDEAFSAFRASPVVAQTRTGAR